MGLHALRALAFARYFNAGKAGGRWAIAQFCQNVFGGWFQNNSNKSQV